MVRGAVDLIGTTGIEELPFSRMVKQKHHTARNQSVKNHKNGIKRPQRQRARCMKGVG